MRMNQRFCAATALLIGMCAIVAGCANEPGTTGAKGTAADDSAPAMGPEAETARKEISVSATGVPQIKNPPAAVTIGNLKSITGKAISLDSLRGKVVILDFWATWCGPCRMTIPLLNEMHEKYNAQGLVIVGISDETVKQVAPFAKGMNMKYTVVADSDNKSIWQVNYQVSSLPTMAVIDRKGKLRMYEKGLDPREGVGTEARLNELIPQLLADK